MLRTCPRCHRANPPEALFCYQDGCALEAHSGQSVAIDPGARPFPFPFVLASGRSCRSFDELALACLDNVSEAVALLRQGDLARFLGGLGRADLARAARAAATFPDDDRALDQWLATLPTRVIEPPRLHVEPLQVNLGTFAVGQDATIQLHLRNQGMGLLHGTLAIVEGVWLSLGDAGTAGKMFQCRDQPIPIPVHVRGARLRAVSRPFSGRLLIESNGGNAQVVFTIEVPRKPFVSGVLDGACTPRQIAEKAKAAPRQAAVLFEQGAVAAWYQSNGWTYPVQGPSASGLGAVQQFFEALGLTTPPKVFLREQALQFQGKAGERLSRTLVAETEEKRPVFAHAVSDQPWLQVAQVHLTGRTADIRLAIASVPDRPGETLKARVIVTANGNQRFVVPVTLGVAGRRSRVVVEGQVLELVPEDEIMTVLPAEPVAKPRLVPAAEVRRGGPARPRSQHEPLDVLPVVEDEDERPRRPGPGRMLAHLLPIFFLIAGLTTTILRDILEREPGKGVPAAPREEPLIALQFHDSEERVTLTTGPGGIKAAPGGRPMNILHGSWEPSMRFGLAAVADPKAPGTGFQKRLTFDAKGKTNNVCLRLDGKELLFGERPFRLDDGRVAGSWPGHWSNPVADLGLDAADRDMRRASTWVYDREHVEITQTVQIVAGAQSGRLDTCLVHYRIENHDVVAHQVGLRFLLDTYIGGNDGVPFLIPGSPALCDTQLDLRSEREIPPYIQACEREDLTSPGTVAQVQLKVAGLEPPARVTLGAWPDPRLRTMDPRCQQEKTMWEVPVFSLKTLTPKDSAVVMYWPERELPAGGKREVGFAYGLGNVAGSEGRGRLAVTVGGSFQPGGVFTVTAYVNNPSPGQTVTLELPEDFRLPAETATQAVPIPPLTAASRNSPVTWQVTAPAAEGTYTLRVRSSTGVTQTQRVRIKAQGIFGG